MLSMLFGPQGDFSLQYRKWPQEKTGSKAERRHRIQVLEYIHAEYRLTEQLVHYTISDFEEKLCSNLRLF